MDCALTHPPAIPKKDTVFRFEVPFPGGGGEAAGEADDDAHSSKPTSLIFELHGSQFQFRPADRANKKFKLKPMDYR